MDMLDLAFDGLKKRLSSVKENMSQKRNHPSTEHKNREVNIRQMSPLEPSSKYCTTVHRVLLTYGLCAPRWSY